MGWDRFAIGLGRCHQSLTIQKEKEGNGWGKEFLLKWMIDNFPSINSGNALKRHNIIKCLEEERIIQKLARGRTGMYATHWTLGSVAKQALGMSDTTTDTMADLLQENQEAPKAAKDTSIYYSSIFCEDSIFAGFFEVGDEMMDIEIDQSYQNIAKEHETVNNDLVTSG